MLIKFKNQNAFQERLINTVDAGSYIYRNNW